MPVGYGADGCPGGFSPPPTTDLIRRRLGRFARELKRQDRDVNHKRAGRILREDYLLWLCKTVALSGQGDNKYDGKIEGPPGTAASSVMLACNLAGRRGELTAEILLDNHGHADDGGRGDEP